MPVSRSYRYPSPLPAGGGANEKEPAVLCLLVVSLQAGRQADYA